MCALRITDPFDPLPAALPVPQLPWPRPPAATPADAAAAARPEPAHAERSWRRYVRPAPQRA